MAFTLNLDENMEFLWSRYGVNNEAGEPKPYEIIEGNIGVINPDFMDLQAGATHANEVKLTEAMNALKDTDGLIVDYRKYPDNSQYYLPTYLFEEPEVGLLTATISEALPGTFLKEPVYNFNHPLGAQCLRLCAAGELPLLRHHRPQHRIRRG